MIKTLEESASRLVLDQKPGSAGWLIGGFVLVWLYISFNILRSGDPIGWIFLAATAFPLLILGLVERQTLVFDRNEDSVSYIKRTPYRRRRQVFELAEVGPAQTAHSPEPKCHRVTITCGGEDITFGTRQHTPRARALVTQINDWLDAQP